MLHKNKTLLINIPGGGVTSRVQPLDVTTAFKNYVWGLLKKHIDQNHKDSHREKASPNKNPALAKSSNTGIWVVGTSNQLFLRGS